MLTYYIFYSVFALSLIALLSICIFMVLKRAYNVFKNIETALAKAVKNKRIKFVQSASPKIKCILSLNESTRYCHFAMKIKKITKCPSWRALNHFDIDTCFLKFVSHNTKLATIFREKIAFNKSVIEDYTRKYYEILNSDISDSLYKKHKFFKDIETALLKDLVLTIPTDVVFRMLAKYRSPQGYTNEKKYQDYSLADFDLFIEKHEEEQRKIASAAYQRSILTPSLRYDILQRDGFRCQICGAKQDDATQLHVDHILPVSKGGKTVKSNLRTLCNRCNLGKRDKFDPYGLN